MTDAELVKQVIELLKRYGMATCATDPLDVFASNLISLVQAQMQECTICGSTDMFNDKVCYSCAETHYS